MNEVGYLQLRGIGKHFGAFTALKNIDLTIRRGEFVCFLGPSGCGKTTLLRIIAGLEPQTSGSIVQVGRDVSILPPAARDYGIMFQSYALFPNLSVAENVAYGLVNRKQPRAQVAARVDELLALVGLPGIGAKYPARCRAASSSGWHWRGPWPRRRGCCCWTSRCPRWTPSCGCTCATRSAACSASWA